MIGPQQPRHSVSEGDAIFELFERLLDTMRNNDYMTRLMATPKNSQDVMSFHRSNWIQFVRLADTRWLAMSDDQKRDHLRAMAIQEIFRRQAQRDHVPRRPQW